MKNRHMKTYSPFCPEISIRPIEHTVYDKTKIYALKSYPGANGDSELALSFLATHYNWSIENAISYYSAYHDNEDRTEYATRWIERCMDYWESKIDV